MQVNSYYPIQTSLYGARISTYQIMIWLCALSAILSMNPYFVWNTYHKGVLSNVVYIIVSISILLLFQKVICMGKVRADYFLVAISLLIIYIYMFIIRAGEDGFQTKVLYGKLLMFVFMALFVMLPKYIKKDIYEKFLLIFIISMIPGLLYGMLELLGGSINYKLLEPESAAKVLADYYYKLYPGAVIWLSANTRLSGIFDEPGMVGTVAGLMLVANGIKLNKNWKNILLLICGVCSLSLAFYTIVLIALCLRCIKRQQWKLFAIILGVIIVYFTILAVRIDNPTFIKLQERLTISDGEFLGNNRLTSKFDYEYQKFISGDIKYKLFGLGRNASSNNPKMYGSSSYKMIIYDYGYFGFIIMLIWITFSFHIENGKKILKYWEAYVLLAVFLASLYQRPSIYFIYYIVILLGGSSSIYIHANSVNKYEKNFDLNIINMK